MSKREDRSNEAVEETGKKEANSCLKEAKEDNNCLKEDKKATADAAEERIKMLELEIEALKAENSSLFQQLQRKQADFENYRKRVIKEREMLEDDILGEFVKSLLPLLDNIERAVASNADGKGLKEGVELILKQFISILEEKGVEVISCLEEAFDPNIHEAVAVVEAEGYLENTVVEELQKGYRLKNKVLRASMVKVAK
ncbi:MAG TPA: nucleotide exchange factor GrpE [Firmicutes bacterium]|nr:nucleotide exchange factor GrpE [Bacillota bacterium]